MKKINKKEKSNRFNTWDTWDISKQSLKKLNEWILWGKNEINGYEMFIELLKKEIKKRK